jgi:hypothetical protein
MDNGAVQGVYFVIHYTDLPGQFGIVGEEGLQALAHHLLDLLGHSGQTIMDGLGGQVLEIQDLFGDVGGRVADALQFVADVVHRHQYPEIYGHGLEKGDEADAFPIDGLFQAVDRVVAGDDLAGQVRVLVEQRREAALDGGFGGLGQFQQPGLQVSQFPVEFIRGRGSAVGFFRHGAPQRPMGYLSLKYHG